MGDSRQYKAVLKELETLTKRLRTAKEVETLLQKFTMEGWIAGGAEATANELVLLALNRIQTRATDYDVFIRMLRSMPGVESLAKQMIEACPLSTPEDGQVTDTSDSGAEGECTEGTGIGADGNRSQKKKKVSMCYNDFTTPGDHDGGDRAEGWALKDLLWKKKEITVLFMDQIPAWYNEKDNPISKDDILQIANEWHDCNKEKVPKFRPYEKHGRSDIRIQFAERGLSWSKVGTEASSTPPDQPTMVLNLGPWTPDYYKSLILHEFGHALGLEHEHQHPDAPDLFDDERLKEHIKHDGSWNGIPSDQEVEKRIKDQWKASPVSPETVVSSPYDKYSVMHYVVDEDARSANYDGPMETPPTLSPADKDYIVKLYSQIKPGGRASGVIRDEGGSGGVPGHGAAGQFNGGSNNTSIMRWCTLASTVTVVIVAIMVAVLLQQGLLPPLFGVTLPDSTLSAARPPTSSQTDPSISKSTESSPSATMPPTPPQAFYQEWLNNEPEMRLLQLIKYTDSKGEKKEFRLIQQIQNYCRNLGTQLGIDEPTLNGIDNSHRNPEQKCKAILDLWMTRDDGKYDVTWAGLLQALEDEQLGREAKHLREALAAAK